jgi:hypothetical protein
MNLKTWPGMMLLLISSLLLIGCIEDEDISIAQGTHIQLMNMGPYAVGLNMTDNSEYYVGSLKTDEGNTRTGPPDCFTYSNYTWYSADIMAKRDGEKKLSLNIGHYDDITNSDWNLLEHGLSVYPWSGDNEERYVFLDNYKWVVLERPEENKTGTACWIDNNTMLSMWMYNTNENDPLEISGSVTVKSQ